MRGAIFAVYMGFAMAPLLVLAEPAPGEGDAGAATEQVVAPIPVSPVTLGGIVGTVAARQAGFAEDRGAAAEGYAFDVARAFPSLTVTERHVSNLYYVPGNRQGSYVATIAPGVQLVRALGNGTGALTYQGEFGFASYDSRDSYSDHFISADYRYTSSLGALNLTMAVERGHEARGTGLSEGAALTRSEPDEFELTGFTSNVNLGPEDERVGVSVDLGLAKLGYLNNDAATRTHDRDARQLSTRVYMGISPAIRFFGEYGRKSIDYDVLPLAGSSFDSDESSLAAGFAFKVGDAASGEFKFGTLDKSFTQSARTKREIKIWSGSFTWQRDDTGFEFRTSNEPEETFNSGDFLEVSDMRLMVRQRVTGQIGAEIYGRKGNSKHVGDPRSDDFQDFGIALTWHAPRWFDTRLFYERNQRDSNIHLFDYKRVEWGVTFSARM